MLSDVRYLFHPTIDDLIRIKDTIQVLLSTWKISADDSMDIILSLDEAITNIILHGYKDRPESSRVDLVELEMDFSINSVDILICDAGKEYDISRIPVPNIEDNMKNNKDGGFGVYLMKSLMDDIKLSRQQNKNCLRMKKSVQPV